LQWLRKAILRASGYKDLHDEGTIYARQVAAARAAASGGRRGVRDWYAFTLSFKGVLLEGLEVVFIAITFGANQQNVGLAAAGAAAAGGGGAGVRVPRGGPPARGPGEHEEVAGGGMPAPVGGVWGAGGGGGWWPGNDVALLAIVPATALVALGYVALLRRARAAARAAVPTAEGSAA